MLWPLAALVEEKGLSEEQAPEKKNHTMLSGPALPESLEAVESGFPDRLTSNTPTHGPPKSSARDANILVLKLHIPESSLHPECFVRSCVRNLGLENTVFILYQ